MKVRNLALAALLSVSATAVIAQESATSVKDGSVKTEESAASQNNGSQVGGIGDVSGQNQDFDLFLKDFGQADFTSAQSDIGAAQSFQVVHISNLPNADKAKLEGATAPRSGDMAALSTVLNGNPNATQALQTEGFSVADVVWARTGANGVVMLYIDDLDAKSDASGGDTSNGDATATPAAPAAQ